MKTFLKAMSVAVVTLSLFLVVSCSSDDEKDYSGDLEAPKVKGLEVKSPYIGLNILTWTVPTKGNGVNVYRVVGDKSDKSAWYLVGQGIKDGYFEDNIYNINAPWTEGTWYYEVQNTGTCNSGYVEQSISAKAPAATYSIDTSDIKLVSSDATTATIQWKGVWKSGVGVGKDEQSFDVAIYYNKGYRDLYKHDSVTGRRAEGSEPVYVGTNKWTQDNGETIEVCVFQYTIDFSEIGCYNNSADSSNTNRIRIRAYAKEGDSEVYANEKVSAVKTNTWTSNSPYTISNVEINETDNNKYLVWSGATTNRGQGLPMGDGTVDSGIKYVVYASYGDYSEKVAGDISEKAAAGSTYSTYTYSLDITAVAQSAKVENVDTPLQGYSVYALYDGKSNSEWCAVDGEPVDSGRRFTATPYETSSGKVTIAFSSPFVTSDGEPLVSGVSNALYIRVYKYDGAFDDRLPNDTAYDATFTPVTTSDTAAFDFLCAKSFKSGEIAVTDLNTAIKSAVKALYSCTDAQLGSSTDTPLSTSPALVVKSTRNGVTKEATIQSYDLPYAVMSGIATKYGSNSLTWRSMSATGDVSGSKVTKVTLTGNAPSYSSQVAKGLYNTQKATYKVFASKDYISGKNNADNMKLLAQEIPAASITATDATYNAQDFSGMAGTVVINLPATLQPTFTADTTGYGRDKIDTTYIYIYAGDVAGTEDGEPIDTTMESKGYIKVTLTDATTASIRENLSDY